MISWSIFGCQRSLKAHFQKNCTTQPSRGSMRVLSLVSPVLYYTLIVYNSTLLGWFRSSLPKSWEFSKISTCQDLRCVGYCPSSNFPWILSGDSSPFILIKRCYRGPATFRRSSVVYTFEQEAPCKTLADRRRHQVPWWSFIRWPQGNLRCLRINISSSVLWDFSSYSHVLPTQL